MPVSAAAKGKKKGGKKHPIGEIKIILKAGKASPAPPVGPMLAQKKLNIPDFCKQFNDRSLKKNKPDTPTPTVITAYSDGSFTFNLKNPPVIYLINQECGIEKGLSDPGKSAGPVVKRSQLRKVAKIKMDEMRVSGEDEALKCVEGSARSAGYTVEDDEAN